GGAADGRDDGQPRLGAPPAPPPALDHRRHGVLALQDAGDQVESGAPPVDGELKARREPECRSPSGADGGASSMTMCRPCGTGAAGTGPRRPGAGRGNASPRRLRRRVSVPGGDDEGRNSPGVPGGGRHLLVRGDLPHPLDQGQLPGGHLRQLPPLLHGAAEAGRHAGAGRALPRPLCQAQGRQVSRAPRQPARRPSRSMRRLLRLLPIALADGARPYIGGQAVLEGVMMRSPKSFVVAVRRPDGSIAVREEPWNNFFTRHRIFRLPFLRGAVVLIESLWNGYVALDFSAQHAAPEEAGKPQSNLAIGLTLVLSLAFGLALFVGLPHFLTWGLGQLLGRPLDTTQLAFHLIDGALRLVIFVGYIALVSRLAEIRRVFQYHGAEHKTIWAYEKGLPVEVETAVAQTTLHPRCGTSFLLIVVGI